MRSATLWWEEVGGGQRHLPESITTVFPLLCAAGGAI